MSERVVRQISEGSRVSLPPLVLEKLPHVFQEQGKVIYKGRNEVRTLEYAGETLVIKKYGIPPIFNRIFYSLGLRTPKAKRSYQNAQQILARGFETPKPLMYEMHYQRSLLQDSYFVSTWTIGAAVSASYKNLELIKAFAQYTAKLHESGLMHRDYMLSNVLYTFSDGSYHFELIDINRFILKKKPINWFLVCVNLMQPFREEEFLKLFVTEYARCRHIKESTLVWWVLRFRRVRNGYSLLKEVLRKLPGARYFSRKAK